MKVMERDDVFLNKVVELLSDNTTINLKELTTSVDIKKKKDEINQLLVLLCTRKTKLGSLFSSRCISSRLWSPEARKMQLSQHIIIQKFIHAVEKEEHFWLQELLKIVHDENKDNSLLKF